ncbi:MAG: hypothetical protein GY696_15570 [Gammaproteobacteria bacterium]|nr:hypothetical protein [Gammaproteobacteria bacterium]
MGVVCGRSQLPTSLPGVALQQIFKSLIERLSQLCMGNPTIFKINLQLLQLHMLGTSSSSTSYQVTVLLIGADIGLTFT